MVSVKGGYQLPSHYLILIPVVSMAVTYWKDQNKSRDRFFATEESGSIFADYRDI
ncbi:MULTISPECIES: hypothetical protein [Sphingobacterium]|uniref:Uncharacterized protein n=1 Tax=Sphingobacterium tenebrionis TaxID=3111775 RepID=A0ABU8I232_9SPHI|nr:hypothetical protein [Sphingobacterium sp. CZ-2]